MGLRSPIVDRQPWPVMRAADAATVLADDHNPRLQQRYGPDRLEREQVDWRKIPLRS